ncbi:MAG: (d)CMP kinase [Sedimentisphaerales bacterium]|nr:(d)CMP kinase [Sedimentisphaerales bacterium]
MADLIVTIDGPAASGKSTVARMLAERLGASFLDTGAMYRAVTLAAIQAGVDMNNEDKLLGVLETSKIQFTAKKNKMTVLINGVDVAEQIRSPEVTANAKHIANAPKVRARLVEMQRQFAAGEEKIVTEGRDQGTVAFPKADLKFYLTATPAERARRRAVEEGLRLGTPDGGVTKDEIEQIQRDIEARDASDRNRSVGPMKAASDAVVVDTTDLSAEEVVEKILEYTGSRAYRLPKMLWPRFARLLCKIFCGTFFRLHPAGRENIPDYGPLVLICNHQSFLDPPLCGIFVKRPLYYLARDTLFRGLFGKLLVSIQTIPVKRGEADLPAMRIVISKLKAGNGVCLFPEGTRTSDGRITAFKPGFGLLCRRGNAAVVPVLIEGAFDTWPRHKKLFSPGGHIDIQYGKCIPASDVKKMDDKELATLLTDTLRKMQNDCRLSQGKKPYDY